MGGVVTPSFEELAKQDAPAETPATTNPTEGTDTTAPVTTESPSGDGEA